MKKNKSIITVILILLIVEIATLFLMYKSFSNKNIDLNKNTTSNNLFAILVEQEDGTYKENNDNNWDSSEYVYNDELSGCVDLSGKEIKGILTYDNGVASITTESSVYCYLYFDRIPELVGDAYALYTESNQTLTFVRSETPYVVGNNYNGVKITAVYTGLEEEVYDWSTLPWSDISGYINSVVFVDEIRPLSTAVWFNDFLAVKTWNLKKLNTSLVTNMSAMFYCATWDLLDVSSFNTSNVTNMTNMFTNDWNDISGRGEIIGLENFDVSNVTNMTGMLATIELNGENIANWDTSNVTAMHMLFAESSISNLNLNNWDVSSVTDMSYMFVWSTVTNLNIESWNTENVIDMSYMFRNTSINKNVDLSKWDVSNVTNYDGFNEGIYGAGTLTPPIWPKTS